MPVPSPMASHDPLQGFREGARVKGSGHPVPLIGTRIDVRIAGGLAVVTTEQRFRNAEEWSIEATITFPVPTAATLTRLQAEIDGRTLIAHCERRDAARARYEAAVDDGKTAVLHEELLRGVHMLSVAHLPPGKEMRITSVWATPLAVAGSDQILRIPMTVGEIYGRSPLADSNDLVTGAHDREADLAVANADGVARVIGGTLVNGAFRVTLNAPLEIVASGAEPRLLKGVAADGRTVLMDIRPAPGGEADLDLELVLDESGSMNSPCAGARAPGEQALSKWSALVDGISAVSGGLRASDRVTVRTFDTGHRVIGDTSGRGLAATVLGIRPKGGGTEIGNALAVATATGCRRDVLLVTDGKSHAIDVQSLARRGRRICVVLVGEDSLEAHVGHLAALTGGDIFVVSGFEVATAIRSAIDSLRKPHEVAPPIEGPPRTLTARRGGMMIRAQWETGPVPGSNCSSDEERAVAAVAAALALPRMAAEPAAALAQAESIVCHLTSLVLVDEAGGRQNAVPAMRKIELAQPMAAGASPSVQALRRERAPAPLIVIDEARPVVFDGAEDHLHLPVMGQARGESSVSASPIRGESRFRRLIENLWSRRIPPGAPENTSPERPVPRPPSNLAVIARAIDWAADPEALRRGDMSGLSPEARMAIQSAAALPEVIALARLCGITATVAAIALLAKSVERGDRTAQRLARSVFGSDAPDEVAHAMDALGL